MCDSGSAVPAKMIPCIKETRPDVDGGRSFCIWRIDQAFNIADLFDGAEVGDKVVLEYCEMTEDLLEALPEFEGW